jgi:hypothetical protein
MNKNSSKLFILLFVFSYLAVTHTYKKSDKSVLVSTVRINSILANSAEVKSINLMTSTSGGDIANDVGANVTSRGVCCGTSPAPTTCDKKNRTVMMH